MRQDQETIRRVLQGDLESFRLLLQKYQRPIVRMIKNITNDKQCCEDIAQDVFLTAYRKLASFDPARGSFSTWLFTIAKNRSLNALKKKTPFSVGRLPEKNDPHNPCDSLAQKELFDELDRQLKVLPGKHKRALVLAEFENLSYQEIAQIEGARIGTIKSRINRAKNKLRAALKDFSGDLV